MLKICSCCKEEKEKDQFYKKGKRLQSMCKKCFSSYCAERWRQRKIEAVKYKGGKCQDCNIEYPMSVYEFHHLDPDKKEFAWNKMRLVSKEKLYNELDKCALLCANCHRIRHWPS